MALTAECALCPSGRRGSTRISSVTRLAIIHMLSHMKRTTLLLDSAVYHELKMRAAIEGRTLTEVVEHALRLGLQVTASAPPGRLQLPSYDPGPFLGDPAHRPPV